MSIFWKCEYCSVPSLLENYSQRYRNARTVFAWMQSLDLHYSVTDLFCPYLWRFISSFNKPINVSGKWISNIYLMIFRSKNRVLITFRARGVVLHFYQASNIEVLNIVSLIFLQILRIKCDFLASILPAALENIFNFAKRTKNRCTKLNATRNM